MRKQYTSEVRNVAFASAPEGEAPGLLRVETSGPWWELLDQLDLSLAVSREYEHRLLLVGGARGRPWQTALELPHPSGLFYDERRDELIVSSTRTPNQIFFFRRLTDADYEREVVPADFPRPDGSLFLPYRSWLLPGSLYIHDLVLLDEEIYVTATGHNFLARILPTGGWQRVWWLACVDGLGRADFYEPYAPGLDPKASRCGIVVVDWRDGSEVASLFWPEGYQIYDVQVMPRVQRPLLPSKPRADEEINAYLRYLG